MKLKEEVHTYMLASLSDPVVKILAENSHLTKTQLETLLLDVLSDSISGKKLKYDEKAKFRQTKAAISRGSFNRTLKQSKQNVVKSLYTVLLLGYLGIFESTILDPYLEIANKLHEYVQAYKDIPSKGGDTNEGRKIIEIIRTELETDLKRLSNPSEGML